MYNYRMTAALFSAGATIALVQPQISVTLSPEAIANKAKEFTVQIEGEKKRSGVILERDGNTYRVLTNWDIKEQKNADVILEEDGNSCTALTNRQAVHKERERQYQIITQDGKKHAVSYSKVRYLPGMDIAVLQFTSSESYPTATLGNSQEMTNGKTIYVGGWTEGSYEFLDAKIVSRLQSPENGYAIVYYNPTAPKSSGGPLLDAEGRLVGIHGKSIWKSIFERDPDEKTLSLGIPIQSFLAGRDKLAPPPGILSPEDLVSLGNCKADAGDDRGAISDYNEAIRINPNYADAYYNRGVVYSDRGEDDRAIFDYNEAIRINPNHADAYYNRGDYYRQRGNLERAIHDFRKAADLYWQQGSTDAIRYKKALENIIELQQ